MVHTEESKAVVIVDADAVDDARRIAMEQGVRVEELSLRNLEPVTTVTLVLLGGAAAVSAVARLIDQNKGGQVIDLRTGATRAIYRTPALMYGLVAIITDDGKATVEVRQPKDMFDSVLETLQRIATDLGKASIEAIAEEARSQLGPAAQVSVQPQRNRKAE